MNTHNLGEVHAVLELIDYAVHGGRRCLREGPYKINSVNRVFFKLFWVSCLGLTFTEGGGALCYKIFTPWLVVLELHCVFGDWEPCWLASWLATYYTTLFGWKNWWLILGKWWIMLIYYREFGFGFLRDFGAIVKVDLGCWCWDYWYWYFGRL